MEMMNLFSLIPTHADCTCYDEQSSVLWSFFQIGLGLKSQVLCFGEGLEKLQALFNQSVKNRNT